MSLNNPLKNLFWNLLKKLSSINSIVESGGEWDTSRRFDILQHPQFLPVPEDFRSGSSLPTFQFRRAAFGVEDPFRFLSMAYDL